MLNLCVNARDAMPNGGILNIAVKQVRPKPSEENSLRPTRRKVFSPVTDTGSGMDEKTKHQIFDPFFTTKEKGKGTGLGLSVVFGVVQTHHGFLDVESEIGVGTSFAVYLPVPALREETIDHRAAMASANMPGGSETLLIVEDEDMLRNVLETVLEEKGYRVMSSPDGADAVELYRKYRQEIQLVLTDVGLPKMNGIEEFRKMKEIDPQVKVLLASGFLGADIKLELFNAGAKGFIRETVRTLRRYFIKYGSRSTEYSDRRQMSGHRFHPNDFRNIVHQRTLNTGTQCHERHRTSLAGAGQTLFHDTLFRYPH